MKTIYQLEPISDKAKKWVFENVQYESYQMMGSSICIETRYVDSIIEAMEEVGLEIQKDFIVS